MAPLLTIRSIPLQRERERNLLLLPQNGKGSLDEL